MSERIDFPIFKYNPVEFKHDLNRGEDIGGRPYDLIKEITKRIPYDSTLLDVGCGSASKLVPLSPSIGNIIGGDIDPGVVANAQRNIFTLGIPNINIKKMDCNHLPFPSNSINMVTFMHSPYNANEAYRVLVDGGYVIAEHIGEQDKPEIRVMFDNNVSTLPNGEVGKNYLKDFFDAGFIEVSVQNFFWKTRYAKDELWALLNSNIKIENFYPAVNIDRFEKMWSKLSEKDMLTLTQHRVLLIAKV